MTDKEKKNVFIGVAWPYVNGDIHIGHLAGYLLPADIYARFHRLRGRDVLMASGSDCHGTPVTVEAEEKGVAPEKIADENHIEQVKLFQDLRLTFDIFTRTTTDNHKEVTQDIFLKALEEGYIFKKVTKQYYSEKEERFLPDRYVEGECPECGYKEARSDQCDNCGSLLSEGELIDPVRGDSGSSVSLKETEHYFFDWPKLEDFLSDYISDKEDSWRKWVFSETEGWLKEGLEPRAITRDLDWGIEIPNDRIPEEKQLENSENKRFYVWFEAVIGYLSASIEWDDEKYKDFWYSDDSIHAYFMGKDNLLFHTLFWPSQLHIYDEDLHLPDIQAINQFLNFKNKKLSKSRGTAIDSRYMIEEYGLDPTRFYLTSVMPEETDSNFTWSDFVEKHNNVLIGTIGNFINRTLNMAQEFENFNDNSIDNEVEEKVLGYLNKIKENISSCNFKNYSENIRDLADFGNKYLSKKEPWKVEDEEEKKKILENGLFVIVGLLLAMRPLLINTYEKLIDIIGIEFKNWPEGESQIIKSKLNNIKIENPSPLFDKIDEEVIEKEESKD